MNRVLVTRARHEQRILTVIKNKLVDVHVRGAAAPDLLERLYFLKLGGGLHLEQFDC